MTAIDLGADVVALTTALVDIESVSGDEKPLTDAVEQALHGIPWLDVWRHENSVVARTALGRDERVVIAGHLDTVPVNDNLPSRNDGAFLHGLGSCDMKGGVAVALKLAAGLAAPSRDLTFVFYECEEVEAERNGILRMGAVRPELMRGDLAVVMEPTNAIVEAGCQGTIRVDIHTVGKRAHAARSWNGVNAIHAAGDVLARLSSYVPRQPVIDGLAFHEGLNAVYISGGVAGNVLPDRCTVSINHRFAPDRSVADAEAHLREVFAGYDLEVSDSAPGALPGLDRAAAAGFVAAVGVPVRPKFGWTDVARFSEMGMAAVNFGPGDPEFAHKQDEHLPLDQLHFCLDAMTAWLS